MATTFTGRKRIRRSFGRLKEVAPMPNLIDIQKASYAAFLQDGVKKEDRKSVGLKSVFEGVFPIEDFSKMSQIEFVDYDLETPKYDVVECQSRGLTYAAPLKITLRLIIWEVNEDTGTKSLAGIKEQEVYMGDLPLMTRTGTFVVNGTERVIVSQMHRSPGVFFDHDRGKTHSSGKYLFSARIIPYHGAWIDFEFDAKDVLYIRIDRRRKLPVTTLLMALDNKESAKKRAEALAKKVPFDVGLVKGMSKEDILAYFYDTIVYTKTRKGWKVPFNVASLQGQAIIDDLVDATTGEVIVKAGTKVTPRAVRKLEDAKTRHVLAPEQALLESSIAEDIIDETGLVLAEAGDPISEELLELLAINKIKKIPTLDIDNINVGSHILKTLSVDKNEMRDSALKDIYRVIRPGEPPTLETADAMLQSLFFDIERYDLSTVGRVKMNSRLGVSMDDVPDSVRTLRREDILMIVKTLVNLKDGHGEVDDIDHLGNRRVRSVGELMENQYRIGLLRMERAIRERMTSADLETVMPQDLINAKPVAAAVREFFGSSQLSQFMDQTNPLAEITHKRRLSALGPGGLTRDRAGFEVRDVHPTHYGRICPIETPEGPNIGLINSLATFAKVNPYGFIESPYRKVIGGKVTDEVIYMSAMDEGRYTIAEANAARDEGGMLTDDLIPCRKNGDYMVARRDDIDLIDLSPKQLVSVAASLIPFLENDDANRALMGSNMQRQAVPLLRAEAPLVGTGMEARVAHDSGVSIVSRRDGVVDQVDARRIVIRAKNVKDVKDSGVDIYTLHKYRRSNQNTCMSQRPLVKVGDEIKAGDIMADGASTELGELALGRNVMVAFMPWNGYNFEDSILISERIVRDDVYTSIHVESFEAMARDTKLGQEEITRDIPNVGDEALKNLDEAGIVYVGAEVKAGDVLVGKVTPKGEAPVTPEEKLLRAIFGEKASDVRDTSLRVPPGERGTVIDVRVFSRRGIEKDERTIAIERAEIERLAKNRDDERAILERSYRNRFVETALGGEVKSGPKGAHKGALVTKELIAECTTADLGRIVLVDEVVSDALEDLRHQFDDSLKAMMSRFEVQVEKAQAGDDLLPGVMKMVKVFVAIKRKLQPGDKMAGRHGNKGVVSRIMPVEDMPYLEDGRPVDIVLNPLGVPSRMNIGQILETHLGWACAGLGGQVAQALEAYQSGLANIESLRDKLEDVYEDPKIAKELKGYSDDDLVELAGNLKKGIPIATPVFDGAREEDINRVLKKAGLDSSGQMRLIDGRTGGYFDRPVTVGYIYMLKLHHLVDDKIHARSTGPYSLVTQQPLGGKAQFGGQRFGEMEVWALEAYGAAHTLQEMLTVKSDDVVGRTRVYEAIVRGDNNFESGIPESFNVLIKELRSLGLNMEMLAED